MALPMAGCSHAGAVVRVSAVVHVDCGDPERAGENGTDGEFAPGQAEEPGSAGPHAQVLVFGCAEVADEDTAQAGEGGKADGQRLLRVNGDNTRERGKGVEDKAAEDRADGLDGDLSEEVTVHGSSGVADTDRVHAGDPTGASGGC